MIALTMEACTGCGTCVRICPHRVIELVDQKAAFVHEERCIECGACQLNCTEGAMLVTKGTGCLIAIIAEDILKLKGKDPAQASCGCG